MDPQVWSQVYDPTGSMVLSTLLAAVPIVILLGLVTAVAVLGFDLPASMAGMAAVYGAGYGLWGIPQVKALLVLDGIWIVKWPMEGCNNLVPPMPPSATAPASP